MLILLAQPVSCLADIEPRMKTLPSFCTADLLMIQAIAYCGAQDYSTYEEGLAATVEDQDQYLGLSLARKRDLADWLRAGLNYIPR